jgi:hypothetical protein
MKYLLSLLICVCVLSKANAQIFLTRNATISFFSSTPMEDIKAVNNQSAAAIDVSKKNLAFNCLLKGFRFPKALMQDHFNENYVESDKYPQASFNGNYTGDIDVSKNGSYNVTASGDLKLHGVTKKISVPATIEVKDGELIAKSNFKVSPADFNIDIPSLVRDKIEKQIAVSVNAVCKRR